MQVHVETLKLVSTEFYQPKQKKIKGWTIKHYTVEVTIRGDRRTVACHPYFSLAPVVVLQEILLYGLALRFSQGSKVWEGTATYWPASGNVNNLMPRIDRRGHFLLVGFFEDFEAKAVASQHNGA